MLTNFYTRFFRIFINIICYITLIGLPIINFFYAGSYFSDGSVDVKNGIIAALITLVVVFLFQLLIISPIIVLFEINHKLNELKIEKLIEVKKEHNNNKY